MRLSVLTALCLCLPLFTAAAAPPDGEAQARRLLNSQGCKACHRIDGEGGSAAPDLSQAGSRLSREQLRAALVNPQQRHAGGRIADFGHLRGEELAALIDFLAGRR